MSAPRAKVCIVQYNASSFLTRVDRAARTLAASGYEVVLIAIKDADTAAFEQRDGYVVKRVTLRSRRLPRRFGLKYVRFAEGIWRTFLCAWREKADIYDARDAYPLLATYVAARLRGARMVYDSDELATGRNQVHAANPVYAWAMRRYERFFARRCAVITSDEGRADVLERIHGIPRPVVVLNVPETMETVLSDEEFRRIALGDRRHLLIYQGVLIANRGIPEMIEAMRLLPECRLAIVGFGALLPRLVRMVEDEGLGDAVAFFDPVPFRTLMCYTAAADVGVIPLVGSCLSYVTAAPNKLFEFMMAGIPVAATDLPDMARVVRETGCGTLISDPTSPEAIAAAVRALIDDPEAARTAGARGRAAALARYNWEVEAPKMLAVFDDLAGEAS
ncbi:MAG: glycosyltransferase family 4 protein [Coriobacteriia bacterium]|nr:glycosyltransferase family 4 protein [Coriobacteriia bacterium]